MIESLQLVLTQLGPFAAAGFYCFFGGIIPMLNTEVFVGVLGGVVGGDYAQIGLVALSAGVGRMIGKTVLYFSVQKGIKLGLGKKRKANENLRKWHDKIEKLPHYKTYTLTFSASAIGFPPMYLLTLAFGILKISWGPHFWIGILGSTFKYGFFFVFGGEISKYIKTIF